jgi:hypothetical protein
MRDESVSGTLEPGILRHMLEELPRKKTLKRLETLLKSGYVSGDECREGLTRLYELDESFRLSLAELLLSQFDLVPDTPSTYQEFTAHFFHQRPSKVQDFADDPHARGRFQDHVLTQLRVSPPTFESGEYIVKCVVHVFTKLMLEGKMGRNITSAERIIYIATRLRQGYQLPDIPVAKHLLLELRYVSSHQNKLLRNVQESEISDSSDSPETSMSDSPFYPTPESTRSPDRSRSS